MATHAAGPDLMPWIATDPESDLAAPTPEPGDEPPGSAAIPAAQAQGLPKEPWLENELNAIGDMTLGDRMLTALAMVGLAGGALALLWVELNGAGGRTTRRSLLVATTELSVATIDAESVRLLAENAAAGNPHTERVRCTLHTKGQGPPEGPQHLDVTCRPVLRPGSSMPEASQDIEDRIREALTRGTGLVVEKVTIAGARFAPLPKGRMIDSPRAGGQRP